MFPCRESNPDHGSESAGSEPLDLMGELMSVENFTRSVEVSFKHHQKRTKRQSLIIDNFKGLDSNALQCSILAFEVYRNETELLLVAQIRYFIQIQCCQDGWRNWAKGGENARS